MSDFTLRHHVVIVGDRSRHLDRERVLSVEDETEITNVNLGSITLPSHPQLVCVAHAGHWYLFCGGMVLSCRLVRAVRFGFVEMLKVLLKRDIAELTSRIAGPCLSLYRSSPDGNVRVGRFQSLFRRAETSLVERGASPSEARAMLRRAADACHAPPADRPHGAGVAAFCSREILRAFCLPIGFISRAKAADGFFLGPLLPWLYQGGHFHILALHHNQARLFHATRYSIGEIELEATGPAAPPSPRVYRFAEAASSYLRGTKTMQIPRDVTRNQAQRELVEHFSEINRRVGFLLNGDESPLVLAGAGFLTNLFETVSTLSNLLKVKVPGSPDLWSEDELRSQAWNIVKQDDTQGENNAVASYCRAAPSSRATELPALLQAAQRRRIATLYIDRNLPQFAAGGRAADGRREGDSRSPGEARQLLVTETLAGGGDVQPVAPEHITLGPGHVAALLRPQ
jgi:hypothetical protein